MNAWTWTLSGIGMYVVLLALMLVWWAKVPR